MTLKVRSGWPLKRPLHSVSRAHFNRVLRRQDACQFQPQMPWRYVFWVGLLMPKEMSARGESRRPALMMVNPSG